MKKFLHIISEMIGQLDVTGEFEPDTVWKMKEAYQVLSEEERKTSIQILDELLREDYKAYFSVMSALLAESKDARLLVYLKEGLLNKNYPLWERYSNMHQLKMMLFRNQMMYRDEKQEYMISKEVYEHILDEIQERIGAVYPYLPYDDRKKTIVITVIQMLGFKHSPTRKVIELYRFFEKFGYTIKIFVCFHPGKSSKDHICWHQALAMNNCMENTSFFEYNTGMEIIKGYNLVLNPGDYLQKIRETIGLIWDTKPEFVFEVGEETMLAGLCSHFTTVVTMGITKAVPVTVSPAVARFFDYSKEEDVEYRSYLDKNQQVVDVKHYSDPAKVLNDNKDSFCQKQDFGISEECFVVVVAGNRLDQEITDEFQDILYEILEQNKQSVLLFIGRCPKLQERFAEGKYADRMFFSGYTKDFRKTIAVGDIFLNPPRQGGGTGAAYAILENVPVITLDHCDVESSVGKAFVCNSTEEMPLLAYRYFSDSEFMEQQKISCKKRVEEKMSVDSMGNFQRLFDVVQKVAYQEEKRNEA